MQTSSLDHEVYMQTAIELGRQNPQAPFASVLVDGRTGKIVASGVNQSVVNPTFHGEIVAINNYVRRGDSAWQSLTLYTTAEPCCMCQGAILWAGIRQAVFGTSIARLKSLGWKQIDIPAVQVVAHSWNPEMQVIGGICEEDCDLLFAEAMSRKRTGADVLETNG